MASNKLTRPMKVKEFINILKEFPEDADVTIYVPGDDPGYWRIERKDQIKIGKYKDSNDSVIEINIY